MEVPHPLFSGSLCVSTLLYRLGRFSYRRKGTVLGAWFIVLLVGVAAAVGLMKPFASSTTIPGTEAQRALSVMERRTRRARVAHRLGPGQVPAQQKPRRAEGNTSARRGGGRGQVSER